MLQIEFTDQAWEEYVSWIKEGRQNILDKIDRLVEETSQHPFSGIGKPKPLQGDLSGAWSRRITSTDRLVYEVEGDRLYILQCKGHYSDK